MRGNLSKSQFMRGVQCQKSLWLFKHKKHVLSAPDDNQQALFDQGHKVGKLAQTCYPNGKEIRYELKPFSEKFKRTWEYINANVPAIYEGTFQANGMMCMVDILNNTDNGWELIEVKSSTSEKEVIIKDIATQYYVVTQAGLPISRVKLMHINNQYARKGTIDTEALFTTVDVTEKVKELQAEIEHKHTTFKSLIMTPSEPDIEIGTYCDLPYECDAKAYCWEKIPEGSIFQLAGMTKEKKFELYYRGITSLTCIPEDVSLSEKEHIQINCAQTQTPNIDKTAVTNFLSTLHYPLYYLDFESFNSPIPPFDHIRPYQQIPFQYSLHIMNSPFDSPAHKDYLGKEGKDPRYALAKGLIKDIPEDACIVVYNRQFEQKIIRELADLYPDLEIALLKRHDQIVDLMVPFKEKAIYYPEMEGSYSIKKVLPALVPDLSYKDLEINNGQIATLAYEKLADESDSTKRQLVRQQLLDYCKLDTLAMVKIIEKMSDLSQ